MNKKCFCQLTCAISKTSTQDSFNVNVTSRLSERVSVLFKKKPQVYHWLHANTSNLGSDRTLELIGSHFYWLKLTENINHFVKTICSLVEKKKSSQIQTTSMQGFTIREASEFNSMNFLCLDKKVTNINTYQHRYTRLEIKKAKQQQRAYIISSSVLESQVKFFTIN